MMEQLTHIGNLLLKFEAPKKIEESYLVFKKFKRFPKAIIKRIQHEIDETVPAYQMFKITKRRIDDIFIRNFMWTKKGPFNIEKPKPRPRGEAGTTTEMFRSSRSQPNLSLPSIKLKEALEVNEGGKSAGRV